MDNTIENLSKVLEALLKTQKGEKEPPAPVSSGEVGIAESIKKHVRNVIDDPGIKEKLRNLFSNKEFKEDLKEELKESSRIQNEALKSFADIVENKEGIESKIQERIISVNEKIENLFKTEKEINQKITEISKDVQQETKTESNKTNANKNVLEEREKIQSVGVVDFSELALEKLSKMFAVNVKQMSKEKEKEKEKETSSDSDGVNWIDTFAQFLRRKDKTGKRGKNKPNKPKSTQSKTKNSKPKTTKVDSETKTTKPKADTKPPKSSKPPKATGVKPPKGAVKAAGKTLAKAGRLAGPLAAVGLAGLEYADRKSEGQTTTQALGGAAGSAAGGAAGGWGGAAAGAALGTVLIPVPVVGTAIGGLVGGILGGMGGSWLGGKAADKLTGADKPKTEMAPTTNQPVVPPSNTATPSNGEVAEETQRFDDRTPTGEPLPVTTKPILQNEEVKQTDIEKDFKIKNVFADNIKASSLVVDNFTKEFSQKQESVNFPKPEKDIKKPENNSTSTIPTSEKIQIKILEAKKNTEEKISTKPNLMSSEATKAVEDFQETETPNELPSDLIKQLRQKTWEGKPEPITPQRANGIQSQKDTEIIKIENDRQVNLELQRLNGKTDESNRLLLSIAQGVNILNKIMSSSENNRGESNMIFNNLQGEQDSELTAIEIAKAGDSSISEWRNEAQGFRNTPV